MLIIDFWHPELSLPEREALEYIYDARNKFETGLRLQRVQNMFFCFLFFILGKATSIDSPYIKEGRTLDVKKYVESKKGFGKLLNDFFSDGGLVKFNPFK